MRNNMLRSFTLLCSVILSLQNSDAQYRSPVGSVNIGISGVAGLNFLEGAQFLDIKPGSAFAAGLSFKYYQTLTIGMQADFLLERLSGNYSQILSLQNDRIKVKYRQRLNFLSIPVNINFYLSDRQESEIVYLTLGLTPSFLLSSRIEDDLGINSDNIRNDADFRKLDFGFSPGVGIELRSIDFLLEYTLGLKNLNGIPEGSRITNHGPRLRINYFMKKWD